MIIAALNTLTVYISQVCSDLSFFMPPNVIFQRRHKALCKCYVMGHKPLLNELIVHYRDLRGSCNILYISAIILQRSELPMEHTNPVIYILRYQNDTAVFSVFTRARVSQFLDNADDHFCCCLRRMMSVIETCVVYRNVVWICEVIHLPKFRDKLS